MNAVIIAEKNFDQYRPGLARWCAIGEREIADIWAIKEGGMPAARAVAARITGWSKSTQYHAARRMVSALRSVDADTLVSSRIVDAGAVPNAPGYVYRAIVSPRLNRLTGAVEWMPLHHFKARA